MGTKPVDQLGLDEQTIDDPSIEAALEERLKRKNSLDAVRKIYDAAHELATAKISELELPEGGAARVGRFRITRTAIPAKTVESFETKASTRVRISLVKDDVETGQEPIENFQRPPVDDTPTPISRRKRGEADQPPAVH